MKNLILILRRLVFPYVLPSIQSLRYSFLALLISVSILPLDIPEEESHIFELAGMTYDIDARLIEGIAYAETGHLKKEKRSTAASKSGALGYMQISPTTAQDICPGSDLYDKIENIFCGAAYLQWIQNHYCKDKDNFCLAMSYRHGPSGYKRKTQLDLRYWSKVKSSIKEKLGEKQSENLDRKPHSFEITGSGYDIAPKLLKGIAYAETGHLKEHKRITAVSSSGALGYMQIMPSTAGDICPGYDLYNKKQNILCSVSYLRWIRKHYCKDKDNFCLVMSYRHGPSAFKKGVRLDWRYWRKVQRFLKS